MLRTIIRIDEDLCNGCGLCVSACEEGALGLVNGKAKLLRDDYCDGFGNCLPACPMEAISFEEREAAAYDEEAVKAAMAKTSCLNNWPIQIKLIPPYAPPLNDSHLLIAADCAAFTYGDFHNDFMKGRITLIGCPKLDGVDYSEKLTAIMSENNIKSVTVTRMSVPCCGGIEYAVNLAIQNSGKTIPEEVVIIATDGSILKD